MFASLLVGRLSSFPGRLSALLICSYCIALSVLYCFALCLACGLVSSPCLYWLLFVLFVYGCLRAFVLRLGPQLRGLRLRAPFSGSSVVKLR
jgi:hypothetical protein